MVERTLIIIKPDGIQRRLAGEIITRFERKGLKLVAAKFTHISESLARELYTAHRGKSFFDPLVKFISSGPSLVMVWEADGAIGMARKIAGATSGLDAQPGSIRGDYSCSGRYNLVHGSDSPESAEAEIRLFFAPDEITTYKLSDAYWLHGRTE
ncbi:MAG: nucleoside-diphosphate kinase [Phycisphaerales bacterium]|nr:MAG: nucleoside-diphosphate kinase [Phycisphaerales bacterium]